MYGNFKNIVLESSLINTQAINDFYDKYFKDSKGMLERIVSYKEFEDDFYKTSKITKQMTNFDSSFIIEINGKKVGISSLNSSWRSYSDKDRGHLLIGEKQIINSKKFISDCDLKIAILHHPVDWLTNFDYRVTDMLLNDGYNLLFNGHVHETDTKVTISFYGRLFTSVASGSLGRDIRSDSRQFAPAYSFIDYNEDCITTIFRRYRYQGNTFVSNTDKGDDGIKRFPTPTQNELDLYTIERKAIKDLIDDKFMEVNTHLIAYGTDTVSPKSVNDLFVLPEITDQPAHESDENYEKYSLDFFLEQNHNFLLFGRKESGKTILLDKMAIEITNKYSRLRKLPVYVNFDEMGNREIISFVRQFLLINNKTALELLKYNRIILLIDNISFDEKNKHKILKFLQLSDKYPDLKIIATSETPIHGVMPTEFLEYPKLNFTPMFIQDFQGEQIRELIHKWFVNKSGVDFQEDLEKLIENFKAFELPRTPLTLSVFLWLIEKQELNPINKANLLERFIEGILEKLRNKEIYSSTFDYTNKMRLLASIAEKILNEEDERISYPDLDKFILNYLKERANEKIFVSTEILDDFIKSTILVKDSNNNVYFRFPCFFEFFLAHQMSYSSSFFQEVLNEGNYLDFVNEINYFTGLHRGEEDILKFCFDQLSSTFEELNNEIQFKKVDRFFEIRNSIFSQQNLAELKKKKPSQKEINDYYDKQVKNLPVPQNTPKRVKAKTREIYTNSLMVTSYVLKNSEEIKNVPLRKEVYKYIIKSTISLSVITKMRVLEYLIKNKNYSAITPKNIGVGFFLRFLPLIYQVTLFDWMGSNKLAQIILDKIESDKNNYNISELEKYLSVFLYADLKSRNYLKICKEFVKKTRQNYILDLSFFKLYTYYFLRGGKSSQTEFLNILGDLETRILKVGKEKKSKIIAKIKANKKQKKP